MAIRDLSDPQAVIDAMSEYDQIGQDEFLRTHGFGHAVNYFVQRDGNFYDSKAIAGVAHGYQFGEPVAGSQFSGGENIATLLSALGFRVTVPGEWHFRIGAITKRDEIKSLYGGSPYGGIESSRTSPNIFVFTDPAAGAVNGYDFDGWDDERPEIFYYTGAGRVGDQKMARGNKAILEHAESERVLRVFEAVPGRNGPGGKSQRYVGAFKLDPADPYRFERAPDSTGQSRQVIVFKLLTDETAPNAGDPRAEREPNDDDGVKAEFIDSEKMNVREYTTAPVTGAIARRTESALVHDFELHLRKKNHDVGRMRFELPRQQGVLVTDTFDRTTMTLFEAKANATRSTMRLALGQVLDYRRYFTTDINCSVLIPQKPIDDLVALMDSYEVGAVWREGDEWQGSRPV